MLDDALETVLFPSPRTMEHHHRHGIRSRTSMHDHGANPTHRKEAKCKELEHTSPFNFDPGYLEPSKEYTIVGLRAWCWPRAVTSRSRSRKVNGSILHVDDERGDSFAEDRFMLNMMMGGTSGYFGAGRAI